MEELKITSPAFEEGGWIPVCHSGYGADISPELIIEGLDSSAVTLAITLDDAGHPLVPNYNHWLAWNIPAVNRIPENLPKGGVCESPFHIEQGMAYGKHCYRGPKPPFNWLHDYVFTVYALDSEISIGADSDKKALLSEVEGHILQKGVLTGKFCRKHE